MSLDTLRASIPAFAKDLRLNLESLLAETGAPGLELRQIRAIAYAAAIASRHRPLTDALAAQAGEALSATELDGVRTAAALILRRRAPAPASPRPRARPRRCAPRPGSPAR